RVQEIQENEAKQRALAGSLKLARQKLKMADDLASAGLMAKMEHVTQESDVETLQGQLNTIGPTVPRLQSALAEVKERIREENAKFSRAAQAQLPEIEVNIARTRELLSQANDQALRTQITSPSEGVIKNMRQNTIGGVVRSGEPIMEIVPLRERLMIEARLSPADRGYVAAGQDALVKVTAYDFARYGGLNGQVMSVAPDTMTGPDNQPYYRMVILTHRGWLGTSERKLPITPGMQAMVDVHTGTRTVLEYLLKPVLKIRYEAFRER
ncbi:MAG: HlyD family type I secretion periplasmic adaptor subunit, partial [Rhodospirillales bacterium]|nr:HlyD family type I secretion periplasmic adaptor subunit [Rhodospirillales bacterium]